MDSMPQTFFLPREACGSTYRSGFRLPIGQPHTTLKIAGPDGKAWAERGNGVGVYEVRSTHL
ncbi:hypothetical protein NSND_62716 [Nitrospira sp. ND1]|nr:hypothetical protein NSND_62716 [Nitrospira sp. ND1]